MRMMSPLIVEGKPLDVAARLAELTGFVSDAARDGLPAHELSGGCGSICCGWVMSCKGSILPWPGMVTAAKP